MREHADRYLHQLAASRGASEHTLRAYRRDLDELLVFTEERGLGQPAELVPVVGEEKDNASKKVYGAEH